jgi:hypothetical protein
LTANAAHIRTTMMATFRALQVFIANPFPRG